jgi:hypothetical protein
MIHEEVDAIQMDRLADNFSQRLGIQVSGGRKRLTKEEVKERRALKQRNRTYMENHVPLPDTSSEETSRKPRLMQGYRDQISKDIHRRVS